MARLVAFDVPLLNIKYTLSQKRGAILTLYGLSLNSKIHFSTRSKNEQPDFVFCLHSHAGERVKFNYLACACCELAQKGRCRLLFDANAGQKK